MSVSPMPSLARTSRAAASRAAQWPLPPKNTIWRSDISVVGQVKRGYNSPRSDAHHPRYLSLVAQARCISERLLPDVLGREGGLPVPHLGLHPRLLAADPPLGALEALALRGVRTES